MRYPLVLLLLTAMLRMPCAAQAPPVTAEELVSVLRLHKNHIYRHHNFQMRYLLGGVPDSLAGRLVIPAGAKIILTAVRDEIREAHMSVHMRVEGDPEVAVEEAYAALIAAGGVFKPEREVTDAGGETGFVIRRTWTQPAVYCTGNREPVTFWAEPERPEANLIGYLALGDPAYACRLRPPRTGPRPTAEELAADGLSEEQIARYMEQVQQQDRVPVPRLATPEKLMGYSSRSWSGNGAGSEMLIRWTSEPIAYVDSLMDAAALHRRFEGQLQDQRWGRRSVSTPFAENIISKWSHVDANEGRWQASLMVERVGRLEDDLIEYRAALTITGGQAAEE